jgi:putative hydrolase of the HAD superfamily
MQSFYPSDDDVSSLDGFHRFFVYMFDLDDTLYPERQYLESAYRGIALDANEAWGVAVGDTVEFLSRSFQTEGRSRLFDRLHDRLLHSGIPVPDKDAYVRRCLGILRSHPCRLALYDHIPYVLQDIRDRGMTTLVVTNGNAAQQRNKVSAIDWLGFDASMEFHFAAETTPKPDPSVFLGGISVRHGIDRGAYLFIGDAETDRAFARNCGVSFMWADRLRELFPPSMADASV